MPAPEPQAPISAAPQNPPDLQARDLRTESAQRYCRVLEKLIDIGTELAGLVLAHAPTAFTHLPADPFALLSAAKSNQSVADGIPFGIKMACFE